MREALTPVQRQKLEQIKTERQQPVPAGDAAPRGPRGAGAPGGGPAPPPQVRGRAPL
jgi:hypothetical protein